MKQLNLFHLLAILILSGSSCTSQPSSLYAPEAGVYTGGTLNVAGTMTYLYNPITGFGAQAGTSVTPGVNLLGDLTITSSGGNTGAYSFSKLKDWKGEWRYDPVTEKLNCTGPLKEALKRYHAAKGFYTITLVATAKPGDKEGVTYSYSKKASKEFPKLSKPNGDLTGMFTIKPDQNTVAFLDAATAGIHKTFGGKAAATNSRHSTIALGFTDNTKYYEISITDATGQVRRYSSSEILSFNWNFLNYQYGILSSDGSTMALLGKTPDSYLNLTYTPGEFAVGIFDLSGRTLGMLPLENNKYIIPSFLPDGRLVYCPKSGGLAITDASYRNAKIIYSNPVNAFAISPDGNTIAFSEGLHFYTMNINGGAKKQVVCGGEALEADNADNVITMAWSPDGKQFAVNYKGGAKYAILSVPLDGSNYRFVRDADGETYQHTGQLISWH